MEHAADPIVRLVFQLALLLLVAKLGGELFERYLKMPAVLGELSAGILIGPFALGGLDLPGIGPVFEDLRSVHGGSTIPVSEGLWSIAQVGSIVLLFMVGLETNLNQFLRYYKAASLVALGGVVLPFIFGVFLTVFFGFAESVTDVRALFIGAVMTATSIGITARVLGDMRQLSTPEGVTILGAAVLDDIIGILILTIVVGLAYSGDVSSSSIGLVALKAIGFWLLLTTLGILLKEHISRLVCGFRGMGASIGLAMSMAFFAAALAESFGLAMIIGAFSMGLALSGTELSKRLEEPLHALFAMLVPIFFVVMGMLVDLSSMGGIWVFGIVLTIFAVIGKLIGSGLPSVLAGFNRKGAWRIGVGMLPRGEVALIMAGIGFSKGILASDLYGVTIMMTVVTTVLAPPILSASFKGGASGIRSVRKDQDSNG